MADDLPNDKLTGSGEGPSARVRSWVQSIGVIGTLASLAYILFPAFGEIKVVTRTGEAQSDVIDTGMAVRAYYTEYGFLPGGSNADVIRALDDNPKKVPFLEIDWNRFSENGEFIDPWGIPYRFDLRSPTEVRIYSSGPNKRDEKGAEGSDDIVSWR